MSFEHLPADYSDEPRLRDMPRTLSNWPRLVLLGLIRLYQVSIAKTLPPDTCRFFRSSAHYCFEQV
jgi:hypothetical protein